MKHYSVLLNETIEALNLQKDSIIVDATLGYGGHSSNILARIKEGFLFAFDQDSEAIAFSTDRLNKIGTNFTIIKSNFCYMMQKLNELGIEEVDGVVFDLGVSSPQLDEKDRGFSFHEDAPLDMRMDRDSKISAYNIVNECEKKDLIRIFKNYGESEFASNIAKHIVTYRQEKKIETTLELVEIIKNAVPMKKRLQKHPARQIFQALRIEVNHELDVIEPALKQASSMLKVGGRIAVISFHSLEDRIVKNFFKDLTKIDDKVKGLPNIPEEYLPDYKLVFNKALTATDEELAENTRSRSAKLRVIERIK